MHMDTFRTDGIYSENLPWTENHTAMTSSARTSNVRQFRKTELIVTVIINVVYVVS